MELVELSERPVPGTQPPHPTTEKLNLHAREQVCEPYGAAIANRAHAAVAISIHADGGPPRGRGFHVIYPPRIRGLTDDIAAASYALARDIRASFRTGTGMPYATYVGHAGLDRRSDLGGLNLSNVPKVFIETGNMQNRRDARLLEAPQFREREARALARGLSVFLARHPPPGR